jgi:hypothetical protein|tara:strand:- start:93 stop:203 length:111 start_codon:yes stop_codon:yes gene_type:complete
VIVATPALAVMGKALEGLTIIQKDVFFWHANRRLFK